MSDRVKLDWRVPSTAWRRFCDYVENEYGRLEGCLGREAERAMKEYADEDGYEHVEELVDRLVRAAGRTPEALCEEKKREIDWDDVTRVTVRVESAVKDAFREVASDADNPFGVVFARALNEYRDGGRSGRCERKLERVVDDGESLLAETNDSSDDGLSTVERRIIAVCNELPDRRRFTDDELVEAIEDKADVHSKPSIKKYRSRVVDRLDVELHPDKPELWVPAYKAAEYAPDGVPKECHQSVEHLSRDEQERRVKLMAGRRAGKVESGRTRLTTTDVRENVLEGEPAKSVTLDIVQSVARDDGFTLDESGGSKHLRVNLKRVGETNAALFEEIIEYRDATNGSTSDSGSRSQVDEGLSEDTVRKPDNSGLGGRDRNRNDTDGDQNQVEQDVADEFARLERATPEQNVATDGGEVTVS